MKNNKYLFIVVLSYFALGLVNMHLALLAFVCMTLPFILLYKYKKKAWCQHYCPRACLYTHCGRATKKFSAKTPKFFTKGPMKWIILVYFVFSLYLIISSTIMVSMGAPAVNYIKVLFAFAINPTPQAVAFASPSWLLHLSYGFYSMMLTTTILGLILALVFRPRTWCTICPISTVSDLLVEKSK